MSAGKYVVGRVNEMWCKKNNDGAKINVQKLSSAKRIAIQHE